MNDFLTAQDILFGLTVLGALAGLWFRIEVKIDKAKQRAEDAEKLLAAYKTHVAETYVTKDGLREQFQQVLAGVADLKQSIGHVANRVDSLVDQQNAPTRRSRGTAQ